MRFPRGKIKLDSLTECGTLVPEGKIEILYEAFEKEDKIKFLDRMWHRKENRDSL